MKFSLRVKKFFKPALRVILGIILFFASLSAFFGGILGYFAGKIYIDKFYGKRVAGKIPLKSLIFNAGNYRVHLHHWLIFLGILIPAIHYDFFPFRSVFSQALLGGLIFHDIYIDKNWYKVLTRKEN